jgi:hypothetical protein
MYFSKQSKIELTNCFELNNLMNFIKSDDYVLVWFGLKIRNIRTKEN